MSPTVTYSRFITALLIISSSIYAGGTEGAEAILSIEGFQSPESVLVADDRRFVSNIGLKIDPMTKDGDGYISEVSMDGEIINVRAFPPGGETLDAPKGMAALGGRLYVADIDTVVGFDLASGERVFTAKVPGDQPAFLNDLAVSAESTLLVTDTMRNAVYRLDVESGAFQLMTAEIPGANGIAVDDGRIYVVGLGANFGGGDVFELTNSATPLRLDDAPHGLLDGLAVLPDGRLLVSDWVAVDRPVSGTLEFVGGLGDSPINTGKELHGPADIAFDAAQGTVWIPTMLNNRVVVVKLTE
jgi:DNA-binding beta-propeller fold protein YncE